MNRSAVKISFIVFLLVVFSCRKQDYCESPTDPQTVCDIAQSLVTGYEDMSVNTSQFRKEYDAATGKVRKVVAGLYSLYLQDSVALLLHYKGSKVYFVSEKKAADTVLIATFDAADRLAKMELGNVDREQFDYTLEPGADFHYSAGKLSGFTRHMDIDLDAVFYTAYDANGNIVRIYSPGDNANSGIFFTYDLSVKATAQYYSDPYGTDYWSNEVYLAEFLGWLPDLMPVNRRTSFRHVFYDEDTTDDEPGYVFNHTDLSDHVYDSDGKLLSYKIADGAVTFINKWNCNPQKNPR